MRRVVVTGMGVVTAAGQDVNQFGITLKNGRSGIKSVPEPGDLPLEIAALLTDFDVDKALGQVQGLTGELHHKARSFARRASLSIQTSIVSTVEAWLQAKLGASEVDPTQVSVVVAGQNLNRFESYTHQQKHQTAIEYLPPRYGIQFLDTDQIGTISELLEIRGEGMTVGGASASGNVGLIQGSRLIQWGVADLCVVVGALMNLSPLEVQAFKSTGALGGKTISDPSKACRPFDEDREGFIYGQGSGCLILESEESAARRRVPPIAEVAGYGMNLDGNRLTNPDSAGEVRAMAQALHTAGVSPYDVDYINTHGTSSVLGDATEIKAIQELFDEAGPTVWLNATKSLTGHCLTAAGIIEAIATIIQMNEASLHPNLNLNNPLETSCRFVGPQSQVAHINFALSNSFGFGGINSSILLKRR
ncbi:MAG: beta-ketoacyl synthase N-terminal-like domain-containing protein [Chloroflexota bacterium]